MSVDQNAKSALRKTILARRDAMDAGARDDLSLSIFEEILHLDCYRRSGVVLAYVGFGSELQTDAFVRRVLDDGKVLLLPRVNRDERRLELYEVKDPAKDLKAGTWGIREPNPERCLRAEADSIDFALVPGAAFDPRGARLGYGGGFYDKLLAGCSEPRPSLVAAAFEFQVVDEVPLEEHDVRVDLIVTEGGTYASNLPD